MADALKLRTSSLEFSALVEGEPGAPLVLCLHGFPDSPATFGHQLRALADTGFRVVVPALRGYEPSSIPEDGDLSLMALADDVIGWLDEHTETWGAAIEFVVESDDELASVIARRQTDRVRFAAPDRVPLAARQAVGDSGIFIADRPVLREGRIELLWVVQEQSISHDYHRYGNLGPRTDETRRPVQ